jgi:very-short-patch-repair endonuclease
LATLSTTIKRFHESKNLLIEWIDYRKAKQQCADSGLAEFIKRVTVQTNNPTQILNAYKQRFYKLWLDAVLPKFPAVANFKGYNHEDIIKEFCQLDKSQFEIAQLRVKNLVINRIADIQTDHDTINEVSILKKEFKKHRKQLPLRKLFGATSHVVTTLRPCFLLSPLSVSIFLDADKYHFDLVIFDEASQVHTEDAIGAIMRGEQAIIVGDSKQLPPTSFFVASLNDEVYDTDETTEQSYNDAGAFESILDEAATVLPACSLKWHYRSRHEHLIAFSNHTIYDNSLITFPSSTDHAKDLGVEYIYVENGIYDRGGKKNNLKEAQKVAQLVFEHFKNYPNRSLGVVTFSEAQQDAIETAIRQKRLESPSFDTYFSESREDPFFIKNLENVQGDERDTIIFSIGYAKDNHGIMYMNFGPLSRDGGYRRLNVAITRAKYNVKLVGSIQPSDIKLDKVNSKGVQLLRSYIEFAQQGLSAIENAPITHKEIQFDSPFEESVYQFLKQNNFDVRTQIGCSRFRIDLAIVNPNDSGKYVLGIECDGATYHSARTARERDRLRQTALEDMGWKIYRIWSTDWINNTKSEQNRLLNAVNSALIKAKEDEQPFAGAKETTSTKSSAKTKSGQSTKSKTAPTSDGNGLFGAIDF